MFSMSAASWVVSSAWTGTMLMAFPCAISSRVRTSRRAARAGRPSVSPDLPIDNQSGPEAGIRDARMRLVFFARLDSDSDGSVGLRFVTFFRAQHFEST